MPSSSRSGGSTHPSRNIYAPLLTWRAQSANLNPEPRTMNYLDSPAYLSEIERMDAPDLELCITRGDPIKPEHLRRALDLLAGAEDERMIAEQAREAAEREKDEEVDRAEEIAEENTALREEIETLKNKA